MTQLTEYEEEEVSSIEAWADTGLRKCVERIIGCIRDYSNECWESEHLDDEWEEWVEDALFGFVSEALDKQFAACSSNLLAKNITLHIGQSRLQKKMLNDRLREATERRLKGFMASMRPFVTNPATPGFDLSEGGSI